MLHINMQKHTLFKHRHSSISCITWYNRFFFNNTVKGTHKQLSNGGNLKLGHDTGIRNSYKLITLFKMNYSVGSTLEKIKISEQDKENKLKEKREYDATIGTLNRTIKETMQHTENIQAEHVVLIKKIDSLKAELVVQKTRRDALVKQVEACKKELEAMKNDSEQRITNVWNIRSGLCSTVQMVADECDVRALLIKPIQPEPITSSANKCDQENSNETKQNEDRLKIAIERQNKAKDERKRLQAEPDVGEEYVRIKNALQYSLDMVSKLNK